MKSGLIAGLLAIESIYSAGLTRRGDVVFESVIEEESTGNGTLAARERAAHGLMPQVDAALIPEVSGEDVQIANPGVLWFEVTLRGRAAYVGLAGASVNAIELATELIARLQILPQRLNAVFDHPAYQGYSQPLTLNVGTISGGDWPSNVPLTCVVGFRLAFPLQWTVQQAKDEIQQHVGEWVETHEWLKQNPPTIRWHGFQARGFAIDPQQPIVALLRRSVAEVTGEPARVSPMFGTADARYFADRGIPAVYYGPAGGGMHAPDEWVDLASVRRVARVLARTMAAWVEMTAELGATLDLAAPPVSIAQARKLASEHFGVHGTVAPLGGERDQNFRVLEPDGTGWVLKVAHPAEAHGLSQLHNDALLHIANTDPSLPVPRIRFPLYGTESSLTWHRPAGGGSITGDLVGVEPDTADLAPAAAMAVDPAGISCQVRMYSYIDGTSWQRVPPSPLLRAQLGHNLARLDLALAGFRHPAAQHDLLWDASKAHRLQTLLDPDDHRGRELLEHFAGHAAVLLPHVRHQVIHNDGNPQNIVVGPSGREIAGIIDFGDIIHGPLVQEVATACAYQIADGTDGLDAASDVIAGYHRVNPLTGTEIDVLFDIIVARLLLIMAITGRRAAQHPQNRDYILRNHRRARQGLDRIADVGCTAAGAELHRILGNAS